MTFQELVYEGLCKRLEGMFVPLLKQGVIFRIIIHEIIGASAKTELTVHSISIFEIADHEYEITVNGSIKIEFLIKNESISCKPTS